MVGTLGRVRLLATDLDGTLLGPTGHISDRNVAALRAAHDAGVIIVIASGRPPVLAAGVIERLDGAAAYGVMANGSVVCTFPDGAPLRQIRFDLGVALDTVRLLRRTDAQFGFALATDRGFAHEHGFAARMPVFPGDGVDDALIAADGATEAVKLMTFHHTLDARDLLVTLPHVIGPDLAVTHMGADCVEIGPNGIDKRSGLIWLCARLGVDAADVVAFGDEVNDHEMLAWAGLGVAMGNASSWTKSVADIETATNAEDGVALVVERLLAGEDLRPHSAR